MEERKAIMLSSETHKALKVLSAQEGLKFDAMVEKLLAVYEVYKNQQNV